MVKRGMIISLLVVLIFSAGCEEITTKGEDVGGNSNKVNVDEESKINVEKPEGDITNPPVQEFPLGDESDNSGLYFEEAVESSSIAIPLDPSKTILGKSCALLNKNNCNLFVKCFWNVEKCEPKPKVFCEDSDGGINEFVTGTTKLLDEEKTDYCSFDSLSWDLVEFYCDQAKSEILNRGILCQNGCKDGVCIARNSENNEQTSPDEPAQDPPQSSGTQQTQNPQPNNNAQPPGSSTQPEPTNGTETEEQEAPITGECTDSDGGINYFEKGITTANGGITTEYCAGYTAYNIVEYYCGPDGKVLNTGYLCPNGCSNGACIP